MIQNGSNTNVYPNSQKNNSSKIFVKKDGDIFSIYFGRDEELYNFECIEKSYNSQNNNKNYSNNLEGKVYKRVLFKNFIENFKKYYLQKIDKEIKNNIIKELTLKQDNSRKKHQNKNFKINKKLISFHRNKYHQNELNRFKEEQIKIQKNITNLKNNKNISNELKSIIKEKYKNVNVNLNILSEEISRFFIENNIVIPMYYYKKIGNKTTYFVNPNILIIRDGSNQDINVRQDNFYLFCKNGERITLNTINKENDDNIRQLNSFFYENLSETLKENLCLSLTKKIKSFFNLERKPYLLKFFDNDLLDFFINKIRNKHTNQIQNKGPRQPNNFPSFEFKNKGAMKKLGELKEKTKKLREESQARINEVKNQYPRI